MKIKKITALLLSAALTMSTTVFAISDTELAEYEQKKTAEYAEIVKDSVSKDGESLSDYLENAIIIPFSMTKSNNRNQFSTYKTSEFYKELYDEKRYYLMTSDGDIIYIDKEGYPERWAFKPESYKGTFKKFFDSGVITEILNTADIETVTDMQIVWDDVVAFFMMYFNTDKGEYAILCDGVSGYRYLPDRELEAFKLYTADEVVDFVKAYLKAEEEYHAAQNKKALAEGYWEVDENGDDLFIQATSEPKATIKPTAEPNTTAKPTATPKATVKPTDLPKETVAPKPSEKPSEIDKPKTLSVRGGDKIALAVDKKTIDFPDAQPFIENDRLLVPVRFISEALGAEVHWFDDIKTVTIIGEQDICMTIGEMEYGLNQKTMQMDVAPKIINERTYVPVRFVAEAMGIKVEWEN